MMPTTERIVLLLIDVGYVPLLTWNSYEANECIMIVG